MRIHETLKAKIDDYKHTAGLGNYVNTFKNFFEDSPEVPEAHIFPGHIFTFLYRPVVPVTPERIPFNEEQYQEWLDRGLEPVTSKPYFDHNPTCMSLGRSKDGSHLVLNFRVIPNQMRYTILEKYWQIFKPVINESFEEVRNKETGKFEFKLLPYDQRLRNSRVARSFYSVNPQFLSEVLGININFAINKYKTEYISRVKLIDWDSVQKIPFAYSSPHDNTMITSNGITGMDEVFSLFELKT